MTCQDARDQFSAWVDGALGAEAAGALDAHLEACAECRRERERFSRTVALVRAVEPARAPVGFVDRVLAAARSEPWPRRLLRRLFWPLPVKLPLEAAAVMLVAVAAVYVYQQSPGVRETAQFGVPAPVVPPRPPSPAPAAPPPPATPLAKKTESAPTPPAERATSVPDETRKAVIARDAGRRQAEPESTGSRTAAVPPPATAPAPEGQGAKEGEVAGRVASRAPAAKAAVPLAAAPAPREAEEAREDKPQVLAPPPSVHRFSARSLVSVDVSGRLVVRDREAARLGLSRLVARLGGTQLARRPDPGAPAVELVEILLPRAAYGEFVGELGRLGEWLPDREVLESPEHVRVVVRLTD